ncbi:MAG: hypothetical protein HY698_10645 [Deltaproteobacteria bacterium]|nr:hypothetical protein [Deltaproteobacteria bacterium]
MSGSARWVTGVVMALLGNACETGLREASTDASSTTPGCTDAAGRSDFPWIRDEILAKHCAVASACHSGSTPAEDLDLTPARAYLGLVGVPSVQQPSLLRVKPGDPGQSYLIIKLGLGDQGLRQKKIMPQNNRPLCPEKLAAVERWISAGAFENPPARPSTDGQGADAQPEATQDAMPHSDATLRRMPTPPADAQRSRRARSDGTLSTQAKKKAKASGACLLEERTNFLT